MIRAWRKFRGWYVLEFFLKEDRKIHLKGLSRELKISPRTSQTYLKLYEKEGVLKRERIGNLILYGLSSTPIALEFKRLYFLLNISLFIENLVKQNPNINSLVLYGSHANGEYDKKSDIDILIISHKKEIDLKAFKSLELKLTKEVKTQVFSIGEWKQLLDKKDPFAISVLKKHILLYGAPL